MADISKITLPSGNTYEIKDATARSLIAGGITFSVAWDGNSTPVVANIPAGVVVTYSATDYTGTKTASSADPGTFYLVKTGTDTNKYDEYVAANGAWERLGSQEVDLSGLGSLAYKNSVTLTTGSGDVVLGEGTTFNVTQPTISVTPSTTNIKATASGTTVGASSTETFVKSYPGATSKLTTTSVPNVTSAGAASTWSFAMGSGDDAETLIISGANGSAPTLGAAITAATGSLSANGEGASVMTGLGTATTGSAVTEVAVTAQPTITLATGATAGTGVISVATGIASATATGAAVSANADDKVTIAKKADLSVTVS